jgi:hypothetical protein
VVDEFARLAEAYQAGAQHTRFPCIDKTDDRNVIGSNRPTVLALARRRRRRRRGARGAEIAHMNPNQLGAFFASGGRAFPQPAEELPRQPRNAISKIARSGVAASSAI